MTLERGIDHIVLAVNDLDAARERFGALGFTTTPPALHPFGTGNSLVQLQDSFIELLAIVEPEKLVPASADSFSFGDHIKGFLATRQGMAMMVVSSEDARADNAMWSDAGLTTFAPLDFSRKATLPDGTEATVAFTVAFAVDPSMPDAVFFVCQQHYPEAFWQPEYQSHVNTAHRMPSVTLAVDEPDRHRNFFAAMLGADAVAASGGGLIVTMPRGVIEVIPAAAVANRFATADGLTMGAGGQFVATTIAVADLAATGQSPARGECPLYRGRRPPPRSFSG